MCTLVLLQERGKLLAVSGNRNELLARPALGPRVADGVLAPYDAAAGGSWLGLNRHGLFVCVTNRRGAMVDPKRKSRGLLVLEALQATDARGLRAALEELPGDRHNGFHLVYADLRDAFVTWGDGAQVRHTELAPDRLHVVTERSFGAGEGEREKQVASDFAGLAPSLEGWRAPMTRHASEPLEGACVHADSFGYGTRSSLQLLLRPSGAEALWTDGHPCTNASRPLDALLASLELNPA
jgi:Transport and Golgi organisation 2